MGGVSPGTLAAAIAYGASATAGAGSAALTPTMSLAVPASTGGAADLPLVGVMVSETVGGNCADGAGAGVIITGEIVLGKTQAVGATFSWRLFGESEVSAPPVDKAAHNPECVTEAKELGPYSYTCKIPPGAASQPVTLLKYRVAATAARTPLHLAVAWDVLPTATDVRITATLPFAATKPLEELTLLVPIAGNVQSMDSQPPALWSAKQQKALWKLNPLTPQARTADMHAHCVTAEAGKKGAIAVSFRSAGTLASAVRLAPVSPPGDTARVGRVLLQFVAKDLVAE